MRASYSGAVLALGLAGCNFVLDGVQSGSPMDPGDLGTAADLAIADLASTAADFAGAPPPDLTHWGRSTATSYDHKNLPSQLIANFVNVGGTPIAQLGTYGVGFSWADGAPTAATSDTTTGVYTYGDGAGFRITAPAETTMHTLTLYAGGQASTARVVAHLSDGSAPDYTVSATLNGGDQNNQFERTVTLSYRAASAGQTLRVDWLQSGSSGFVHVHSATLQ